MKSTNTRFGRLDCKGSPKVAKYKIAKLELNHIEVAEKGVITLNMTLLNLTIFFGTYSPATRGKTVSLLCGDEFLYALVIYGKFCHDLAMSCSEAGHASSPWINLIYPTASVHVHPTSFPPPSLGTKDAPVIYI